MEINYQSLQHHCESLGICLLTSQELFEIAPEPPLKRLVLIKLGCKHKCMITKLVWQILALTTGDCPMCVNGTDVIHEIIETQLMERHITIQQIDQMKCDYHTITCLYALTKHTRGVIVSDLIKVWIYQDGKCAKCKCKMYPTLSTRAMHLEKNKLFCKNC